MVYEKPSIYPEPEPEILVVDTPTVLEQHIGAARRQATATLREAHSKVHGVVSQWIDLEHAVEHRVKALRAPNESLTPGLLYVGVAALTGSVIARGRLMRFILPPTFLALSFNHFLPQTSHNISEYLGEVETRYFPTVAEKHSIANAHTAMTIERVKTGLHGGLESAEDGLSKVVRAIEETTGLKVAQALGRGQAAVKKAEVGVKQMAQDLSHKTQEEAAKAEKKVEESKDKVVEEVKRRV